MKVLIVGTDSIPGTGRFEVTAIGFSLPLLMKGVVAWRFEKSLRAAHHGVLYSGRSAVVGTCVNLAPVSTIRYSAIMPPRLFSLVATATCPDSP
jgi:hypothetical protein